MGHRLKVFSWSCALPARNLRESLQRLILGSSVTEQINMQALSSLCRKVELAKQSRV
jgi:hypothetical protein